MGNPDSLLAYLEGLSDDEVMRFKADIHDRLPVLFEDCRARAKVCEIGPAPGRASLAVDLMAAHPRLADECQDFVRKMSSITGSPVDWLLTVTYLIELECLRVGRKTNFGYMLRILSEAFPGRKPYTRRNEKERAK